MACDVDWSTVATSSSRDDGQLVCRNPAQLGSTWNRWKVSLPAPQHQSLFGKALAAARMREARSNKRSAALAHAPADNMNLALAELRKKGLLHDTTVSAKPGKGIGKIILHGVGMKRRRLPCGVILAAGFSKIRRRNDVARCFKISGKTVGKFRIVSAYVTWKLDNIWLVRMRKEFDEKKHTIFVSGAMSDATKMALNLPIHEGLSAQATTSSWNSLVSNQRMNCCVPRIGLGGFFQAEFIRPNVPLLSDAAGTQYRTNY